ncbi:hypothetical protein ODS41_01190 [Pyrobaculum sp. 3827-6]|nr:hypothetical protein [Pyrobaculum sp. 3827-6]MCU7786544.1 hypothetical protein [Pyrobaculum sp. 3827-6]
MTAALTSPGPTSRLLKPRISPSCAFTTAEQSAPLLYTTYT